LEGKWSQLRRRRKSKKIWEKIRIIVGQVGKIEACKKQGELGAKRIYSISCHNSFK
jgi:hypothetical protein